MLEFDENFKNELIQIIKEANTGSAALTNRQAAMLFHWIRHINDEDYAWVPEEYKKDMPQYRGDK